jgi:hypothetical protein
MCVVDSGFAIPSQTPDLETLEVVSVKWEVIPISFRIASVPSQGVAVLSFSSDPLLGPNYDLGEIGYECDQSFPG